MKKKYRAIVIAILGIILAGVLFTLNHEFNMRTEKVGANEYIKTEDIRELIPEVIATVKSRYKISANAYVRCEITFDSNYNSQLLDLSIIDRNEENELIEYQYVKQNGQSIHEILRVCDDDVEAFGGNLLLVDFEELVSGLNTDLFTETESDSYILTVRDYSSRYYNKKEKDRAYCYSEKKYDRVDSATGTIGISIKGTNEIALYLK